jgi:hypothetical protein
MAKDRGAARIHEDTWVWGKEKIVWGFDPSHQYTFKILEPLPGRAGCLSLQYHQKKSESWLLLRGQAWILVVVDGKVCTRIMKPRDIQNLPCGVIHRVTAITPDCQIAEPSTPDAHAADKSVPKDVVRLHCYHGRPVMPPKDDVERRIVELCVKYTDEAMKAIAEGKTPKELEVEFLVGRGAFSL